MIDVYQILRFFFLFFTLFEKIRHGFKKTPQNILKSCVKMDKREETRGAPAKQREGVSERVRFNGADSPGGVG